MCVCYHLSLWTLSVDDGRERQGYLLVPHSCLNSQRFVCAGSQEIQTPQTQKQTVTRASRVSQQ